MNEIRFELDCDLGTPHFHEEVEILYVLSGRDVYKRQPLICPGWDWIGLQRQRRNL